MAREGRKSKLHCANPRKNTRRFKGGVARLASECEGIKSTLWVWPDQKRVWRSLTAQSDADWQGRGDKGIWRRGKGKESEPTPRQEVENYQKVNGLWVGFLFCFSKGRYAGLKGEGLRSDWSLITAERDGGGSGAEPLNEHVRLALSTCWCGARYFAATESQRKVVSDADSVFSELGSRSVRLNCSLHFVLSATLSRSPAVLRCSLTVFW